MNKLLTFLGGAALVFGGLSAQASPEKIAPNASGEQEIWEERLKGDYDMPVYKEIKLQTAGTLYVTMSDGSYSPEELMHGKGCIFKDQRGNEQVYASKVDKSNWDDDYYEGSITWIYENIAAGTYYCVVDDNVLANITFTPTIRTVDVAFDLEKNYNAPVEATDAVVITYKLPTGATGTVTVDGLNAQTFDAPVTFHIAPVEGYTITVELDGEEYGNVQPAENGSFDVAVFENEDVVWITIGITSDIETGIYGINAENGRYNVINLNGVRVLDTDNAADLGQLPKGIYIINGKKVSVK